MPHQRLVADIATEVDPDGRPYYGQVIVSLPRQCGKTTLSLALELHRALMWGDPQAIAYTAQTGMDARQKLMRDQVPLVEGSPIYKAVRQIYRANGSEAIIFRNGSRIDPLPNTPSAGHGRTLDFGVIDEARFDADDTREAALLPAMITRPQAQLLVISTPGDQRSAYFRRKVEEGRRAVERGDTTGVAFFEWGAGEDVDIDDPAVWHRVIPAMNLTIDEEAIRQRRATMPEGEFRREHLGQWTTVDESILPARLIERVLDEEAAPSGTLCFGIDVAMDRSWAAIAVADETGTVELVEHREGVSWVVDRALGLWRQHRGALIIDGYSPANSIVDRLETGGIPVTRYTVRDMTAACGVFYDAILEQTIRLRPHPSLEAAIASVQRKHVGSGWLWSRTTDAADLSPIFAATLAHYHATNRKNPPKQRSRIF
jgi:phage terminase large subunit-like protein